MESVPHRIRYRICSLHARLPLWFLFLLAMASLLGRATTPVPIQTIYVIPGSHWDLGFLRPPEAEKDAIKPHLDAVIAACQADPQFRWTIESGWQLEAWLDRTKDAAQVERLAGLLRSGQIELSAAYGSMHTEFMGSEELNRLVSAGRRIEQRFGVHPKVAMMNDVPGFSMRVPQVLARSGIRYLMTGSNTAIGGGTQLWPGRVPFYWKSPDGSAVLTWQMQGKNGGYTEGMADYYLDPGAEDPYLHTKFYPKEWTGLSNLEIMQRGIDKLLKQYVDAGYRQSAVAVFYMHDGIGPEYELKGLLPNVRAWNASGRLPRMVVATPLEYFAYLENHGVQNAPVYKGDWSGLWTEVKVNSPAMSADARALQELLPQTETLWSLLAMKRPATKYPNDEIESDYAGLFEYDEHNGAGQGGWPKVLSRQEVLEQNQQYSDKLRGGRASAVALLNSGLEKLAPVVSDQQPGKRTLLVYNPRSWTRSHLVRVPNLQGFWIVRDADSGEVIPSQHLDSGELYFEARQVPMLGYRTYWLEPSVVSAAKSAVADPTVLESPYFRVELNPTTGAVRRITDLRTHRILVDDKEGGHAGTLMLNSVIYAEPGAASSVALHRERGSVVDQVIITRPGSLWPQSIVSLPQSEPVVHFSEVLDRSKMRFVATGKPRDMYSFAFDFSLQGKVQQWIDNGDGLYRFPDDLLPGARSDGVVPRHTLVWNEDSGTSSYHVILAQKQAFFDRLQTRTSPGSSHATDGVLADVMIKHDQGETRDLGITSFETYEPGYPTTYNFAFSLTGEAGAADSVSAHQFGVSDESDFVELPPNRRPSSWTKSLISLSAPNVIVEVLKPSSNGNPDDFLLRLQEIAGKPAELSLQLPLRLRSIAETTITEDHDLQSGIQPNAISLSPYQTLTLRLSVLRRAGAASGEEN